VSPSFFERGSRWGAVIATGAHASRSAGSGCAAIGAPLGGGGPGAGAGASPGIDATGRAGAGRAAVAEAAVAGTAAAPAGMAAAPTVTTDSGAPQRPHVSPSPNKRYPHERHLRIAGYRSLLWGG
jgi:hypothetical protein